MTNTTKISVKKYRNYAQDYLYYIICKKLELNEPITLEDAVTIWSKHVCRNQTLGAPTRIYQYLGKEGEVLEKHCLISEAEINQFSVRWLVSTIGILVLKGHLKITPMLNLE